MKTVSIGNDGFDSIRERKCFYVDKTVLIKEWWESEDKGTLITRPRRFWKTLNMNMLECFFSMKYKGRGICSTDWPSGNTRDTGSCRESILSFFLRLQTSNCYRWSGRLRLYASSNCALSFLFSSKASSYFSLYLSSVTISFLIFSIAFSDPYSHIKPVSDAYIRMYFKIQWNTG